MVCLHATDPATVYLSAWARVDGMTVSDLERALYAERSLVKHLAMRRTLFVFPREVLGVAQAGASDRVAAVRAAQAHPRCREGGTASTTVSAGCPRRRGRSWRRCPMGARPRRRSCGAELPVLEGSIAYGEGKSWGGQVSVGPRVLTTLSAAGHIVRASNDGGWSVSRPRWASMTAWLGEPFARASEAEGLAGLIERWLRTFGPGTEADLKWWLGTTVTGVRKALAELDAVEVDLDGRTGYLLPDDLETTDPVEPWTALLPPLDPTIMGWFERDWYLGPYKEQLFDSTGNGGPSVWWEGRIVGGWRQRDTGEVELQLLEDVGRDAVGAIEDEAARLTAWFDGVRVMPRFPSPLSKAIAETAR